MLSFVVTKEGEFKAPRLPTAQFETLQDGQSFYIPFESIRSDNKLRQHCKEMGITLGCVFRCRRDKAAQAYEITRYSDERNRDAYPLHVLQVGEAFHVPIEIEAAEQAFRVWISIQGKKAGKRFGIRKHVTHGVYEVFRKG